MKAVVNKLSALLLLSLIVAFLITSCTKKPETVGLDLVDEDSPVLGLDTTILVTAYSKLDDSVYTDETSVSMLGSMTTSTFGLTNASFYSHIRTSLLNPQMGDDPQFDSAVLTMVYNGAYGNILTEQNIKIHRVTEFIHIDSTYYSNAYFDHDSNTFYANHTFTPDTTRETLVDTSNQDTTYQAARLKINLNQQFGQDIFDLDNNPIDSAWATNDKFIKFFNGLYFNVEDITTPEEGGILFFDMVSDYSNLTLYYRDGEDTLELRFLINLNCARVGRYEHNYNLSTDPDFALIGDSIPGTDKLFLQCLGGVKTEIQFPGLEDWADGKTRVINEAKLILTSTGDYLPDYPPSPKLVMFKNIDDDGDGITDGFDFIRDQMQGEAYFGGKLDESTNTYFFRLSLHVHDILAGEVDLGLALYPNAKSVRAYETKFFGMNPNNPGQIKLNIIYTEIE